MADGAATPALRGLRKNGDRRIRIGLVVGHGGYLRHRRIAQPLQSEMAFAQDDRPALAFFRGSEPYVRVRGEEPFDKWPPRILQGFEYRVR